MERYELRIIDFNNNYFHFTKRINLENIEINGLIPQKGEHAELLEKTSKVFFVEGLDNLLILFDCWINVYKKIPLLSLSHGLGSKCMKSNKFPMFLVDIYFFLIKNSYFHKRNAYKVFDKLLDECCLLNLDIEEGVDFRFDDIDEIKSQNFRRKDLVTMGYSPKYSNVFSTEMDKWNLHTFSNHIIAPEKLKICTINNSDSIEDIFVFALQNTKLDLKNICPVLYNYLIKRKYI